MPMPDDRDRDGDGGTGEYSEEPATGGGGETNQPLTPERENIYSNPEEEMKRDEMANLFFTLATQIGKSDELIKTLMANTITIKQKRYFRMDIHQEHDFLKALETINQNLGKAQAMLDTYIELEKSQPEFKNFYNKFYHLFESINNHRRTLFYNYNATNEEYMYPLIDIATKFGGLSFLFSRLCGVLITSGNYIKHVLYLSPRSISPTGEGYPGGYSGGYGGGGGYYPHSYPPSMRDYYDEDRFGASRKEPKQEIRDIGDRLDTR